MRRIAALAAALVAAIAAGAVAMAPASCARDEAAPTVERTGRAANALTTCVKQIEPTSPAPVGAWTVLKTDGTVWQTPRAPSGEYVNAVVDQVPELGPEVELLADADGESTTTCVVKKDRALWCWGGNFCGNVGNGTLQPVPDPVEILGVADALARKVATASTGRTVTCAVTVDGDLYCWGQNDRGQVGIGIASPGAPPTSCIPGPQKVSGPGNALERNVKKVAAGGDHVCAVTRNGDLYCWGSNEFGQAGAPALGTNVVSPALVALGADRAIDVTAGAQSTCAILAPTTGAVSGEVTCFGRNSTGAGEGALGLSTGEANRATPAKLGWLGAQVARVDVGARTACAIDPAGKLSCWGANDIGQVGDGTTQNRAPGAVPQDLGQGATQVGVGVRATCAVKGTSAFCWGTSVLPDGKVGNASRPAVVDFCHLTLDGGVPGGACETADECNDLTPVCQAGRCRRCRQDSECRPESPACQPNGTCGECSASNAIRCAADTPACDVAAGVCTNACTVDADCGDGTSGKVCDTSVQRCRDGCRAVNGNLCGPGLFCTSRTEEIGFCRGGVEEDASAEREAGTGPFTFQSECAVGQPGTPSRPSPAPGAALAIAALAIARMRRRR